MPRPRSAGATSSSGTVLRPRGASQSRTQPPRPLRARKASGSFGPVKLLVLGGTKFLGRATVEAALARDHEVTLFNRGETNAELFPEAEKLRGDRTQDLSALDGRAWDAVVDPSGYVPG